MKYVPSTLRMFWSALFRYALMINVSALPLIAPCQKAFNSSLTKTEGFIIAHPYMAVLLIFGFLAAVIMAIKRLLNDDTDLEAEHRYIKGGRLD